jgi:hypothetical protein
MSKERLPNAAGSELVARVAKDAYSDDGDVDGVSVHLGHAPYGPLRNAPLTDDAVDARDHLRTVREEHCARVEPLEVAQPKVHPSMVSSTSPTAGEPLSRKRLKTSVHVGKAGCILSAGEAELTERPSGSFVERGREVLPGSFFRRCRGRAARSGEVSLTWEELASWWPPPRGLLREACFSESEEVGQPGLEPPNRCYPSPDEFAQPRLFSHVPERRDQPEPTLSVPNQLAPCPPRAPRGRAGRTGVRRA